LFEIGLCPRYDPIRGKRLVVELLCALLLVAPGSLFARDGIEVQVTRIDGTMVGGVLLRVDLTEQTLVLNDHGSGIKVGVAAIDSIRYENGRRGSRTIDKSVLIGGGVGLAIGGSMALASTSHLRSEYGGGFVLLSTGVGLLGGLLTGLLASASSGLQREARIRGESPRQVEKILKKLKKRALYKE